MLSTRRWLEKHTAGNRTSSTDMESWRSREKDATKLPSQQRWTHSSLLLFMFPLLLFVIVVVPTFHHYGNNSLEGTTCTYSVVDTECIAEGKTGYYGSEGIQTALLCGVLWSLAAATTTLVVLRMGWDATMIKCLESFVLLMTSINNNNNPTNYETVRIELTDWSPHWNGLTKQEEEEVPLLESSQRSIPTCCTTMMSTEESCGKKYAEEDTPTTTTNTSSSASHPKPVPPHIGVGSGKEPPRTISGIRAGLVSSMCLRRHHSNYSCLGSSSFALAHHCRTDVAVDEQQLVAVDESELEDVVCYKELLLDHPKEQDNRQEVCSSWEDTSLADSHHHETVHVENARMATTGDISTTIEPNLVSATSDADILFCEQATASPPARRLSSVTTATTMSSSISTDGYTMPPWLEKEMKEEDHVVEMNSSNLLSLFLGSITSSEVETDAAPDEWSVHNAPPWSDFHGKQTVEQDF